MPDTYPPGEVYDKLDIFRAELLRNERQASSAMVREYGKIWSRLSDDIRNLIAEYNRSGGQYAPEQWIAQYDRLTKLKSQVEAELRKFSTFAEKSILREQQAAIEAALKHAEQLVIGAMGVLPEGVSPSQAIVLAGFNRLPSEAFANLVGFLQDGTPLRDLLALLPGEGAQVVIDGLLQGLMLGQGAREIARNIRAGMGGNLNSAMRTARTEVIRAYREATHQSYLANAHLVKGWIWRSARNVRTCASCWAMDGTEHELSERLDDHPCGRCTAVPRTVTWKELGYNVPEVVHEKPSGIEAFARLPEKDKLMVLGPAKYRAFESGKISLSDLVGRKWDRRWGSMRYERSLKDVLSNKP